MSRTISVIYDEIMAEKHSMEQLSALQPDVDTAQTMLTELNSSSKVAVWRLWVWITAVAMWIHEKLWDEFKAEVDAIVAAAIPGTARWYREIALLWQTSGTLGWVDNKYQYNLVNPSLRVITRASAEDVSGLVQIKVAKDVNGEPVPLDTDQKDAFIAYMNQMKFAGVFLDITSNAADTVTVTATVNYDPQILTSIGARVDGTSGTPVVDAVNAFCKNIEWNGRMYRQKLIDAIQQVEGVIDVTVTTIQVNKSGSAPATLTDRYYQTDSGYIKLSSSSTFTYQVD